MNDDLFWIDEVLEEDVESKHFVGGCWEGRGDDEC